MSFVEQRHCEHTCPHHIKLVGKVLIDGCWIWRTTLAAAYPEAVCRQLAQAYWRALKEEPTNTPWQSALRRAGRER